MKRQGGAGKRVSRRGAALIFAAVCVIFSLLVLGGAKLAALRADVTAAYDGATGSIVDDMRKHNENAYNILTVARRIMGEDDADVKELDAAYREISGAATPGALYAADQRIDAAVITVVGKLNDAGMNDKDTRLVAAEKSAMDSQDMIVARSEYNARVAEYESAVSGFPANLIALARGLGAPEYYR